MPRAQCTLLRLIANCFPTFSTRVDATQKLEKEFYSMTLQTMFC
jgi:hypothetical protein